MFSNGSWLQIIAIILIIFVDEQTYKLISKKYVFFDSYLFDHDNASERKNNLELHTNLDLCWWWIVD